jgi:hypothetical protein
VVKETPNQGKTKDCGVCALITLGLLSKHWDIAALGRITWSKEVGQAARKMTKAQIEKQDLSEGHLQFHSCFLPMGPILDRAGRTLKESLDASRMTVSIALGPTVEDLVDLYKKFKNRSPSYSQVSSASEDEVREYFDRYLKKGFPTLTFDADPQIKRAAGKEKGWLRKRSFLKHQLSEVAENQQRPRQFSPRILIGEQREGALEVPVEGSVDKSQKKRERKAEEKIP